MNLQKMFEVQNLQNYLVFKNSKGSKKNSQEEILRFLIELSKLANKVKDFSDRDEKILFTFKDILEIYIEGLHFLFSIGNCLEIKSSFILCKYTGINNIKTESFLRIYGKAIYFNEYPSVLNYIELFTMYLGLAEAFNFSQDEIEETYLKKYI